VWVTYSVWGGSLLLPSWLILLTQLLFLVDRPFDILGVFGTRPGGRIWGLARARALAVEVETRREGVPWRVSGPEWAFVVVWCWGRVLYQVGLLGRYLVWVVVGAVVQVMAETVEEWRRSGGW